MNPLVSVIFAGLLASSLALLGWGTWQLRRADASLSADVNGLLLKGLGALALVALTTMILLLALGPR